jgi:tRNA-uridine 2-sulfurtransferase
MNTRKNVFVGLSGGVDSSVAACRLLNQGYEVVGVFIKVWHPDFLVCNWEQERLDAMRVAAHLDIPFLTCNAEAAYKNEVADYFIGEYTAGRTPNPDVMCNKHVKFGAFMDFAKAHGADFIATGHYAQKITNQSINELHRGVDSNKDQSYFLYSLTNEQMNFVLLPVGDSTKDIIRNEALKAGIPTATKKDSQGVCFLGHIDIKDFLSHYVDLTPGEVIDEAGNVIGRHDGSLIYTVGQRHGFDINTHVENRAAYYVKSKDLKNNLITVCSTQPKLEIENEITISNFVFRNEVCTGEEYEAQTRYRQKPFKVLITDKTAEVVKLQILENSDAVATGQSCVLYRGSLCLGGGIIN